LQDAGRDTVEANVELGFEADYREYELPAQVLKMLGVEKVKLMTNNPDKVSALESAGIRVTERVSAEIAPQETFAAYVRTKQEKMGHIVETMVSDE
jgi:GTP cyclohydrolase II